MVKIKRPKITTIIKLPKKEDVTINIQEEVNPTFKEVWMSTKTYNVLSGGRNSFKSSVISLLLVFKMVFFISIRQQANVVVVRKVANTIRDSVYRKIWWAIGKFGMTKQFKGRKSPFTITHKKTGSTFHFYGQDDFQKLKSNDIGNIIAVWYEEAAEFQKEEDFKQSNITFMRQNIPGYKVQFFWSYNPPRNRYSWINEWQRQLKKDDRYLVHHSSYLDDELGLVNDDMLEDMEQTKKMNLDYYNYIYLGIPSAEDNYFFSDIIINDIEPRKDARYFLGVDSAYKGKDKIIASLTSLEDGAVRILDAVSIKKSDWKDGETSTKIVNQLMYIIEKFDVEMVCCDEGYGVYIIEELAKIAKTKNFNVKGINFGSSPTKERKELNHYAATTTINKRAEMHVTLQELMYEQKVTFTSDMKELLEEQMSVVKDKVKPNGKIAIIPKDEIKELLGHSPDELDAVLLSIHALILSSISGEDTTSGYASIGKGVRK